ncbi:MAG TPA: DUF6279 family lipoprotein [Noviherbaspirillum sp.]|uniref:DUF6279 family lipoprotein n=1 Tax=Noviherbaspirillum sp. TaxID=1926288 RepID=UPI002D5F721E|nr:DUF6279 family lipoprotein [Noviherbaspirillum sp.]HYD95035.1 DUF6279 family lipoprotein [Noviherbaspirillum sp.]
MRPHRAFLPRLSLFLLACLLAGCSALRLGYANGDTVIYWWLNGYLDFTHEQKPWVRAHVDRLFEWHRRTQLRDYVQLLSQVQERLQRGPATPRDIHGDFAAVRKRAVLVLEKAVPELTDLAMSLEPQQIAHLEKKFASNNEKYRKEYLQGTIEDRQRLRYKKVMNQAEYWFGGFSEEQEAQIRAASDARPLDNEILLAERVRRQQEMLGMLRKIQAEQPSREAVSQMLREYIARGAGNFTYAENKAFFDGSADGLAQLIAAIVNMATPEQKAHAVKRLQRWIDDCNGLAARE